MGWWSFCWKAKKIESINISFYLLWNNLLQLRFHIISLVIYLHGKVMEGNWLQLSLDGLNVRIIFLNDFYYYYYLFIVIFYIAHAFHLLLKKVTTYKEEKTEYFYALKNEFYKWRCKIRLWTNPNFMTITICPKLEKKISRL